MTIREQWVAQQKETLDKLINWAGGMSTLRSLLGLPTTAHIHGWVRRGRISATYAIKAEIITEGLITKEQLRPDVTRWDV